MLYYFFIFYAVLMFFVTVMFVSSQKREKAWNKTVKNKNKSFEYKFENNSVAHNGFKKIFQFFKSKG